ncbi:MAG: cyclin-dependent kinase [Solumvirus sp.]|uniref:Cyclin-dependent kinase n=1 Tax=Solumvirus sp. TaxID=2487773 RepID=A0A3G5AJ70_9VIRU|nr:MAG: cyclin-dependent kinase [Solumvirus sp.]
MESFVINKEIGKGTYGKVYEAANSKGEKYAIKTIKIGRNGIPNILEPSIMSTFRHPNLANSLFVQTHPQKLYIVMDLAVSDLASETRYSKRKEYLDIKTVKLWCHGLAKAVDCLHRNNIIHCDIKAANCLLFGLKGGGTIKNGTLAKALSTEATLGASSRATLPSEATVKLSDFGLSMLDNNTLYDHEVCTSTHRPPEVYDGKLWNSSIDIWALACTFYEIAYGISLFPYHGKRSEATLQKAKRCLQLFGESHPMGRQRYFGESVVGGDHFEDLKGSDKEGVSDNSLIIKHPDIFYSEDHRLLNDLIFSMLQVSDVRPSSKKILEHKFFADINNDIDYAIVSSPNIALSKEEHGHLEKQLKKYVDPDNASSEDIIELAIEIYARCKGSSSDVEYRIPTVAMIANKLICPFWDISNFRIPPKTSEKYYKELLRVEQDICKYLEFRLHTASKTTL